MYTVRIEHGRKPGHSVVSCAAYDVDETADGGTVVTLRIPTADGEIEKRRIELSQAGKIFVMNDNGVTVDVIRPKGKAEK